jgi:hypothetical protein
MKKTFVAVILCTLFLGLSWGQTNPTPVSLTYSQDFGISSFSTLPTGFAAWNGTGAIKTQSSAESSTATGDASVSARTSTTTSGGVYGLAISSNGRAYIQSSSNTTNGRNQLALALDTTGFTDITISFTINVELAPDTSRPYGVVAQYRVGTSGTWTTFANGAIQFTNETAGTSVSFSDLAFGTDAENQSNVQVRWATWRGDGSGSSGGLSIDNIEINGLTGGNTPPAITDIVQTPSTDIINTTTVSVSATITDSDGTVTSAQLRWGTATGVYGNTIGMTASGSTYTTNSNIPAQTAGTTVYYVIDATDDDLDTTTSSEQSYTVIAPATTTIPYTEDFSAGWGQTYRYDIAGTKPWYIYNNDNASCNGYGSTLEEHWLVLPGINFNNYSNERMTFNTIATYGVIDANNYLKLMYSSNYLGLGDPSSATWTEISFTPAPPQDPGPGIETSSGVLDLSGISGTNVYLAFKYYSTNSPTRWEIDDINIYLATPLITVNPATLTGFTYQGTGPSTAQTFTVSGADLTADIVLTAPTNYEISLSENTGYTSSLTLTAAKLGVNETTIYVRLKAGLTVGNYNNEVITASSTGATSKTVTCSGEVFTATAVPFCHWNFNTDPPASSSDNWTAPIASDSGTGSITYTFANATSFAGSTNNAAFGDAAGGSFAPVAGTNQVNNGEEFVMTVDTSGRENIVMTYATRGTSTGFTTQGIYYSVDDGANFILFDTLTGMNVATWSVQTMDFSTITGANDNSSFMVKIIVDGATSDSGNNRFDNILFFGDANAPTPVELSSFTATISAQNYITLTWVTQTETGMRGYYIYRGTDSDIVGAQNVSPLIPSLNSSQMQTYMFEDTEVYETGTYYYWLQTNDLDGTVNYHGPVSVFYNSLGDNPTPEIPLATKLHAVYPNPFNPLVFIPFSLAKDNDVSFKIYNSRGQIVKHYELGNKAAGNYRITWDGTDYNGNTLSNGVYQIVMTAGSQVYQTKTTLLK